MNSKTDQVQAHRFMLGRLTSALLRVDPDAPESPLHRTYRGSTIGALIATLACLAMLLYGLISPGGNETWKVDGALVVVDSSGARYLYAGGRLLPVLNFASAKLVAGDQLRVEHVAEKSLGEVPRGDPLGIVGAPDSIPAVTAESWQVCASVGRDEPGASTLAVGGGELTAPLPEDEAVVVVTSDGGTSLLWRGRRHRVVTERGALDALDGVPSPVRTPAALLDALPAGPDFAPMTIGSLGEQGPLLGSVQSRVGGLYAASGDPAQRYVLTTGGLTPISELDARLLIADPEVRRAAYAGGEVVITQLPGRVVSEHLSRAEAPPPVRPPKVAVPHGGQGVCAVVTPDGDAPRTHLALANSVPEGGVAPSAQPGVAAACKRVDAIAVRPGAGALVRAAAASGTVSDQVFLVTDTGVKYPVPEKGLDALGLDPAASVGLPATLLSLLPTGGSLDPFSLRNGGAVMPVAAACGT